MRAGARRGAKLAPAGRHGLPLAPATPIALAEKSAAYQVLVARDRDGMWFARQ